MRTASLTKMHFHGVHNGARFFFRPPAGRLAVTCREFMFYVDTTVARGRFSPPAQKLRTARLLPLRTVRKQLFI